MTVAAASSRSRYRTRLTDRARWRFSSRLRLRHRRRAADLTFGGGSAAPARSAPQGEPGTRLGAPKGSGRRRGACRSRSRTSSRLAVSHEPASPQRSSSSSAPRSRSPSWCSGAASPFPRSPGPRRRSRRWRPRRPRPRAARQCLLGGGRDPVRDAGCHAGETVAPTPTSSAPPTVPPDAATAAPSPTAHRRRPARRRAATSHADTARDTAAHGHGRHRYGDPEPPAICCGPARTEPTAGSTRSAPVTSSSASPTYFGVPLARIYAMNEGLQARFLQIGQQIEIPTPTL